VTKCSGDGGIPRSDDRESEAAVATTTQPDEDDAHADSAEVGADELAVDMAQW
jgi:hypothetical protein